MESNDACGGSRGCVFDRLLCGSVANVLWAAFGCGVKLARSCCVKGVGFGEFFGSESFKSFTGAFGG
jgi:hypothetical protein